MMHEPGDAQLRRRSRAPLAGGGEPPAPGSERGRRARPRPARRPASASAGRRRSPRLSWPPGAESCARSPRDRDATRRTRSDESWVPDRLREVAAHDQLTRLRLGDRPDTVADLTKDGTRERRARSLPASSSVASCAGVQRPRWTISAIAERTWLRSLLRRPKSSAARVIGASGQRPGCGTGSRSVRSTTGPRRGGGDRPGRAGGSGRSGRHPTHAVQLERVETGEHGIVAGVEQRGLPPVAPPEMPGTGAQLPPDGGCGPAGPALQ